MRDDSGHAATLAFRMASRMGGFTGHSSGGGGEGILSDTDLGSVTTRVGQDTFSHTVSSMIQAVGYFESALSLKTAVGTQASLAGLAMVKNKVPGLWSRR